MGEIAEMMLDGTLCAGCGVFLNEEPDGYPCFCGHCQRDGTMKSQLEAEPVRAVPRRQVKQPKVKCTCGRWISPVGMQKHLHDYHVKGAGAALALAKGEQA